MNRLYHVTEVLGIFRNSYGIIPHETLEQARVLGIEFHAQALGWAVDPELTLPCAPDSQVRSYLEKFQDWFREYVAEALIVEKRVSWESVGITGRIDLVARMRGDKEASVIDLKRVASVSPLAGLQTEAYRQILESQFKLKCQRRFALHVPVDGPCRAVEFTNKADWTTFLAALHCYKYLLAVGYIQRKRRI